MGNFYDPVDYTVGNWTVKSLVTDTNVLLPKQVSIPDLDYADDFTKKKGDNGESRYINVTSASLVSPEYIRYGQQDKSDCYANTDIPATYRSDARGATKTLVAIESRVQATNSVSGETVIFPLKCSITTEVPTASCIGEDCLYWALGRALGALFYTGSTNIDREADLANGVLDI